METTAIVILNYNNYQDTINCIDSIVVYNTAEIKIFIVDNGSTDKECVPKLDSYLSKKFKDDYVKICYGKDRMFNSHKMTFIVSDSNDGYACGNNKALEYIRDVEDIKYILILNNDILFVQDIIPRLKKELDTLPKAAIVSPILLKKDRKSIDYECARRNANIWDIILQNVLLVLHIKSNNKKLYILKDDKMAVKAEAIRIELPSGSCMLLRKDFFFRIGCFDPNTFLYYEENILAKKIQSEKKYNYVIPDLKCIHLGARTTSKDYDDYNYFVRSYESQKYYVEHYSGACMCGKIIYRLSLAMIFLSKGLAVVVKRVFKLFV